MGKKEDCGKRAQKNIRFDLDFSFTRRRTFRVKITADASEWAQNEMGEKNIQNTNGK